MTDLIHDAGAEVALLAGLLAFPQTRTAVARLVGPSDFASTLHGDLAAVLWDLDDYDPQAVLTACQRRGLPHAVRLVPTLVGRETVPELVLGHAMTVRDCSRRRRLRETLVRGVQQVETPTTDLADVLVACMGVLEELVDTTSTDDVPPINVADFLAGEDRPDWVVDGLIARSDRVVLTGGEGAGKSELARMVAVCVAAGVHPFTLEPVEPKRVLILDLENSRELLRSRLRVLAHCAKRQGRAVDPDRLRIINRPAGVDLGDAMDSAWLARQVELAKPDLIVGGPLYRMHTSALDKEDAARQITVALDSICNRSRSALILEAHAGHGMGGTRWWRPTGSSLFMRWAQFGLGLRTTKRGTEVTSWRGARDVRGWPEALRRGGEGTWPWLEAAPFASDEGQVSVA